MRSDWRLDDLCPARRHLVELIREIEFGRIEDLLFQNGRPLFNPPPKIFHEFKLDRSEATKCPADPSGDYALKTQVRSLLRRLASAGDGRVEWIVIAHGLPLRLSIEAGCSLSRDKCSTSGSLN